MWLLKKNAFATHSMSYASGQSVAVTTKCSKAGSKVPAQRCRARVRGDVLRETCCGRRVAGDGDCHGTATGRAGWGWCTIASRQACCGRRGLPRDCRRRAGLGLCEIASMQACCGETGTCRRAPSWHRMIHELCTFAGGRRASSWHRMTHELCTASVSTRLLLPYLCTGELAGGPQMLVGGLQVCCRVPESLAPLASLLASL